MGVAQTVATRQAAAEEVGQFQVDQVVTISAGHFVHDSFTAAVAPWLPLLIDKLGLSLTMAGSLVAFQQLPSLINPFLGAWADRHSLRWLAILAPTVTATTIGLLGLAPSYTALVVLLLVSGLSTAAWHVAGPVIVAQSSGRRVGQGMSFFMLGGELAYTVGPLLAVGVVALWGLGGTYHLIPLGVLASALVYWRTQDGGFRRAKQTNGSWGEAWHVLRPVMLPMAGVLAAQGCMSAALATFLPTFLASEGASLWLAGGALSILELAGAFGVLASGTLSDRVGRREMLALAMAVAPALMLFFLSVEGWAIFPALFAVGFVAFAPNPVMLALVQEHGGDRPATANGIYMAMSFVGRSLITIVIGAVADRWGLRTAFVYSALAGFAGVPFALLLPRRSGQPVPGAGAHTEP